MIRTPIPASVLPFALLVATAACAGGARPAPAPAPAPAQAEAAPEPIEETFAITPESAPTPAATDALLGSTAYDLPVVANSWVQMEVDFLVGQRRGTIGRWMENGERYQGWVQEVFARYGLPRDLHHLAMVESGYSPTARSHAGAVGMWQFMSSTGRGMGLRIDDLVDERMDPVRSTDAAARHLRDLHRSFGGDWALAAAAYNAGSGRISRGMQRIAASDFWDLAVRGDLAQETRHYVPRLYAVTIIARDPQRFGYAPPRGVVRPFGYDSVRVDVPTPLAELARVAGVPAAALAELNPHLYRGIAPANYWVWTPDGSGAAVQVAFDSSAFRREGGVDQYTLRPGETVEQVAAATGLTVDRIRDLNLSRRIDGLGRGDRVRLPATAVRMLEARPIERVAARSERAAEADDAEERPRARAARPSRRERAEDEEGSSSTRRSSREASGEDRGERESSARSGESRRSEARSGRDEEEARPARARETERRASSERSEGVREGRSGERRASAERATGGTERGSSSPARSGRGLRSHTVENGETLWGIARRFDVTVAQLREVNSLEGDDPIQPGQALRIPRSSPAEEEKPAETRRESSSRERASEGRRESATRERASESREGGSTARREGETRRESGSATRRREVNDAEHVVRSGDTLWSLARRYETTVDAIRAANRMAEGASIQPGQRLRIPRG